MPWYGEGFDNSPAGRLYHWFTDYPTSEDQYRQQSFLAGLPIIGSYYSSRDNTQYLSDYMRNTGLDWSDLKYPSRTVGWGNSGQINFLSSNVKKLYKRR